MKQEEGKIVARLTPVSGYDFPGLKRYLEQQAARGLRFSFTAGPLTCFIQGPKQEVSIHLECAREKTDQEDEQLNALYREAGWSFWGIFRKNFYVYASTTQTDASAHTDPEILRYSIRRFLRQKLFGGLGLLIANFFLLSFYFPGMFLLESLQYFPVSTLFGGRVLPFFVLLSGLLLIDVSYLHGLWTLLRLSRRLRRGQPLSPAPGSRLAAVAVVLAAFLLGVTLCNFLTQIFNYDNPWIPLEETNFVTLSEIEGADFRLTGDPSFNMDHVSYSNTLLSAERWTFRQFGSFPQWDDTLNLNSVPHLEVYVSRYPLSALAKQRVTEWSYYGGSDQYETLEPAYGLDQILILEGKTTTFLILRMDCTVLRADYLGSKNLADYLQRFAQMMESL
ncbi:MAG: DUF2812 domain-containing protein [Lawsonibacter sp.]|jgi:hypothetical protein